MRHPWIKDDSMFGSQTFQSLNHDASSYVLPGFLLIFHSFIPLIPGSMCQSPGLQSGAGQWEGMGFKGNSVRVKADKPCTEQPINRRNALKLHSVIIGFLDTSYLLLHYFMSCFPKENYLKQNPKKSCGSSKHHGEWGICPGLSSGPSDLDV